VRACSHVGNSLNVGASSNATLHTPHKWGSYGIGQEEVAPLRGGDVKETYKLFKRSQDIGEKTVTKKMKILIPIIVIVLLGILAVNVYFSLLIEEKEPWRSLKETPSPTQQE
jgi:hypothetical protein